jgi:hypothetical protein
MSRDDRKEKAQVNLTLQSDRILEAWGEEFVIGRIRPKKLINAIVHVYWYDHDKTLQTIDFSRRIVASSTEFLLNKKTTEHLYDLSARILKAKNCDLKPSDLVNHLIEYSASEKDTIRPYIKEHLINSVKADPKQIMLDLPISLLNRAKKVAAKSKGKPELITFLSEQLELFVSDRTEDQIKEEIKKLLAVATEESKVEDSGGKNQETRFETTFLEVGKKTKSKISESRVRGHGFVNRVALILEIVIKNSSNH